MIKKAVWISLWIGLTLSVLGLVAATPVSADEWDKKSEAPLMTAMQTAPLGTVAPGAVGVMQEGQPARTTLPHTPGNLTVVALCLCVAICFGTLLMLFRRVPAVAPTK